MDSPKIRTLAWTSILAFAIAGVSALARWLFNMQSDVACALALILFGLLVGALALAGERIVEWRRQKSVPSKEAGGDHES